MDLATYRGFAAELNKELEEVFKKHGLKMSKLNAGVDDRLGVVKYSITCVDVNLKAADGSQTTPEAERFKQMAHFYGMKPEWLGHTFTMGGKPYKLEGLKNTRGRKNVIVSNGGKMYVMPAEDVVLRINAMMLK